MLLHAVKILDETNAISELLKMPKGEIAPTIRMTAPPLLAEVFLSPIMNEFLHTHESIRFECLLSNDLLHLEENEIDLAIRIGKFRQPESQNYQVLQLGLVSRVICASPKYIQKFGKPKSVQDLRNHRILHFGMINEFNVHIGIWENQ